MKTMKKVTAVLLLVCMLTALCSVGAYATEGENNTTASVEFTSDETSVNVDDNAEMEIKYTLPEGKKLSSLVVTSGDPDILKVENEGGYPSLIADSNKATISVKGITAGEATLTCKFTYVDTNDLQGTTAEKVTTTKSITVINPAVVTRITLNKDTTSIYVGGNETLTATITPATAAGQAIDWSSDTASVATVENGKVTAVAEGTATITASAGGKTATCVVTVNPAPIQVKEITLTSATVNVGKTVKLTATVKPDDATNKSLSWGSGDTSIATVDSSGVVTGIKEGKTTITATALDGSNVTAFCEVEVKAIPVQTVTITDGDSIDLDYNTSKTLTATVTPDDATDRTITWNSSDPSVVSVASSTGLINGLKPGSVTVTATAADGSGMRDSITVNVKGSITISGGSTVVEGQSVQLTATLNPTNTDSSVTWKSDKETVATVDASGKVTGVKKGEVTITAEKSDYKTASYKVTVVGANDTYITITPVNPTITTRGGAVTLTATVMKNGSATNESVNMYISSASPAGNGAALTKINENTATLTANYNGTYVVRADYTDSATGTSTNTTTTVTVKYQPSVISGNYSSYNGKDAMLFVVNDSYYNHSGSIWVDGIKVLSDYYKYESSPEGMIRIWLSPYLLNQLSKTSTHTLVIGDKYGDATAYFRTYSTTTTINGVKTGDDANIALWAALTALSAAAAAGAVITFKRRREK